MNPTTTRTAAWFLLAAALAARCSSPPPPDDTPPLRSPSERKQRMLLAAEGVIHQVMRDARRDVLAVRNEFDVAVDALPLPSMLGVTDQKLQNFDQPARDERAKTITAIMVKTQARLKALLDHYEKALWTVATEAGKLEHGSELGSKTGYQDLDDKVESALLQLARDADVDEIEQFATLHIYDHVGLDRAIREDVTGLGILSLYKSPPVKGLFALNQEGQAAVIVFQRDGIDPLVPLSYVQAVRRLVMRAGIIETETPWMLDPATPKKDGVVPQSPDVDPKYYVVSEEARPAVDTHAQDFDHLFDHVLVSEYRTALRRDDTGEFITTIGWQVRWIVDFQGTMRVLVERSDLVLPDDPILPRLLHLPPKPPKPPSGS
jgi:hypothetical protein